MNQLSVMDSCLACVNPADVVRLQDALLEMPPADIETIHRFKPGVYERTIRIPAWTVLTGAAHKTAYRVRLDQGSIAVNIDGLVKLLHAPVEFDAPAGVQRAGRVFENEVLWTDIYDNSDDCTDIATLESRLYDIPACGLGENRRADHADFLEFSKEIGLTPEQIDRVSQIEYDLIAMPAGVQTEVKKSYLNGLGLFATTDFKASEVIAPGRIDGKRTPAGRYTNHSKRPNAKPVKKGKDIDVIALIDLKAGQEILIDYRESMLVNFGHQTRKEPICLDSLLQPL